MKLFLYPVDLKLRHVFRITHGATDVQRNVIVELRDGPHRGYGETAPVGYYGITRERILAALESVRPQVESSNFADPSEFWQRLHPLLADHPFAQCALDLAAHDLWGKHLGQPVYALWGLSTRAGPPTNYTIGMDPIEVMVRKLKEFPGFPVYKIKLGTGDDVAILRELRRHTEARFRVDANTGWSAAQTIENSRRLRDLGVEFIEQPMPAAAWEEMKDVHARSALPVIADESCVAEPDVDRCAGYFHGVNVKLTKAGGLTPGRRMILRARDLGLKTMVGCMPESSVGISAIAQLLPLLDYVDMDGALLLERDPASGVRIDKGRVIYPDENGCGVRLREDFQQFVVRNQRVETQGSVTKIPRFQKPSG